MPKVFKNGNALVVTVPKAYAHQLKIRDGSKVEWTQKDEGLLLTSERKELAKDVDAQFMKMADEFITEHKDVLRELSKK